MTSARINAPTEYSADCFVCGRIALADAGQNPEFVARLRTGYVFLNGGRQEYRGYTLFSSTRCVPELHSLNSTWQTAFLREMAAVGHSVFQAFEPAKLNYALLGNGVPHLHWHIIPRYADDPNPQRTIWEGPSPVAIPTVAMGSLRDALLRELERTVRDAIEATYKDLRPGLAVKRADSNADSNP